MAAAPLPVAGPVPPSGLRRNLAANVAGVVLPLAAAAIAFPLLVDQLGMQRFGVFTLLMAGLTYAATLDLGLGAALTYRLAALARHDGAAGIRGEALLRTALGSVVTLGLLLAAALVAVAAGVRRVGVEGIAPALRDEVLDAVQVLALGIPAAFASGVFAGVLSARQRFVALNRVRAPMGALTYLGPALVSLWWPGLVPLSAMLVAIRWLQAAVHGWQCRRLMRGAWRRRPWPSLPHLRLLLGFGGWLTVSNLIGPVMVYLDRFYLGAVRMAEDVALYVTPFEVASRLALIPAVAVPVLFPLFVARLGRRPQSPDGLIEQSAWLVATACALPAGVLAAGAPYLLDAWLGARFAGESAAVLQILAGAALANCVALVFHTHVQAQGRTDRIARLHAAELLLYLASLWVLTDRLGIVGTALAWALRMAVDATALCALAGCALAPARRRALWQVLGVTLALGALMALLPWLAGTGWRALVLVAPLALAWRERDRWLALLRKGPTPARAEEG